MVFIHLNQSILNLLPTQLPQSIPPFIFQNQKYLHYQDFRSIAKKYKIQLHKFVRRSDIVFNSQIQNQLELKRRTPIQIKFIQQLKEQQLKEHQNLKKGNFQSPGKGFILCKQDQFQPQSNLTNQIIQTGRLAFGICMMAVLSYFIAQNKVGLGSIESLCISSVFSVGAFFANCLLSKNQTQLKKNLNWQVNNKLRNNLVVTKQRVLIGNQIKKFKKKKTSKILYQKNKDK